MDKVWLVLATAKKQYFWVLSGLAVVLALVSWAWATSDLAKRAKLRKDKLEKSLGEMRNIAGIPLHPNENVIKAINEKTGALKGNVLEAWKLLFSEQKAKNQLPRSLGEEFKSVWDLYADRTDEMPVNYRQFYQNFIQEYLPKLKDMVNWRHSRDEAASRPGVRPGMGEAEGVRPPSRMVNGEVVAAEMIGVVDWDETDWKNLYTHFQFAGCPTTQQMRLAQEDLWVYEALLRVIANLNKGITEHHEATVKRIVALSIGRDVTMGTNRSRESGGGPHGGMVDADIGGMGPMATPGGVVPAAVEGAIGPGAGLSASDPVSGRYVDNDGKALMANARPPFEEFKMMPVRMELAMNQNKIPALLVECANSSMPIEIRAVRLRPGKGYKLNLGTPAVPGVGGTEAGLPGGAMAGPTRRPTMGGEGGVAGGFGGMEGGTGPGASTDTGYWDVRLEVEGVIYIYNPPDRAKLGTGAATTEPQPEQPPTTPTPPTPPPATPTPPAATPATPAGPAATPTPPPATPAPPAAAPAGPAATPAAVPPGPGPATPAAPPAAAK